ncbi:MAG: S8 family serine peptidase [Actinomycetota bacterium]|nr:S8 family serine peptidase [Actinomycetota bacterium]
MRSPFLLISIVAGLLAAPAASAAEYVPGEVIVKYRDGTTAKERTHLLRDSDMALDERLPGDSRELAIRDGDTVPEKLAELRREPDVEYAVPNFVARASFRPNDPGYGRQWHLRDGFGIEMPTAWDTARRLGAPGGRGATVAVLDTGVAYRRTRRFRRAPDLRGFARGYDFVGRDRRPDDENGHGTHVAGALAQTTNNRRGAAGIAYRARIMPVRVLDSVGEGDAGTIARALRWAARRRPDVINLSLEFGPEVRTADVPDVVSALRYAHRRGVTVVAAGGNSGDDRQISLPARGRGVIAVGATTHRGCQAVYSNKGRDLDVVAPGGGEDAALNGNPYDSALCRPNRPGRWIYQQTFTSGLRRFGLPPGYEGTSMSAAQVSGIVALVRATRRLGTRRPSPGAMEAHIKRTAREAGPAGFDPYYGHGLVSATRALASR